MIARFSGHGGRGLRRLGALGALLAVPLAGCDVDVADPEIAQPEQIITEENTPLLLEGAVADFGLALTGNSGSQEGVILTGGLRADEFGSSDTFESRAEVDRGVIGTDNDRVVVVYRNLHRARQAAETAAEAYAQFLPNEPGRAEALSLAGYSYVLFGETFCPGVPFTDLNEDGKTFEFGQPLPTDSIFERAAAQFNDAITFAQAAGDEELEYLARVGLARAELGLGNYAAAAAAVATVPDDFAYVVERSSASGRQNNGVFVFNRSSFRYTVSETEGINGLAFETADDPRVVVDTAYESSGAVKLGVDNETPLLFQYKYNSRDADVVLASGLEANLIEAEAALQSGNYATPTTGTLAILNALRAEAGLTPLAAAATEAAQVDQLFRERAFWLFATGHRLGDLRRLVNQYGRAIETVFPTGTYLKTGAPYGNEINLPVPDDELNNPNFTGCTSRVN